MKQSELYGEKRPHPWREIAETALMTLFLFLVIRFAIQNFNIDGTSMEPTLHNKELILVDKWTYQIQPPARGDVIVFAAPPDPSQDYVKRIIAVPGDTVTVRGTAIIVDGVALGENYVATQNQGVPPGTHQVTNLVIPPSTYFVLGDNRAISSDSRTWGLVPQSALIGRAIFIYWPLKADNSGFLHDASPIFAAIGLKHPQASNLLSTFTTHINVIWLLIFLTFALLLLRKKIFAHWLQFPQTKQSSELKQ